MITILKTPYGKNENGVYVKATEAIKGNTYYCPNCNQALITKKGEIRQHHFSHKPNESCSEEKIFIAIAKYLTIKRIEDWKNNEASAPLIRRSCNTKDCLNYVQQKFPKDITHAEQDIEIYGIKFDVVIFKNDEIRCGISINHQKALNRFNSIQCNTPWFVVSAEDIIKNQDEFLPAYDRLLNFNNRICAECLAKRKTEEKHQKEELENRKKYQESMQLEGKKKKETLKYILELAERHNITLPPSPPYNYHTEMCDNCNQKVIIYYFEGSGRGTSLKKQPPEPKPETIKLRKSKIFNKTEYWTNTCYFCGNYIGEIL